MADTKHYELMYIIPAKFAGEELTTIKNKVKEILTTEGAEISNESEMGRRRLSYPIKHVYQGFYFVLEMDLEPGKLKRVNDLLTLMTKVLRFIIVDKRIMTEREIESVRRMHEALEAELREKGIIKDDVKVETPVVAVIKEDVVKEVKEEAVKEVKEEAKEEAKEELVEEVKEEVKKEEKDETKVSLEEMDKNLDDIVSGDINELL